MDNCKCQTAEPTALWFVACAHCLRKVTLPLFTAKWRKKKSIFQLISWGNYNKSKQIPN